MLMPYKLTKNKPISYEHFAEFLESFKARKTGDNAWMVQVEDIKEYDLSAKNPNKQEAITHKSPLELVESIKENSAEVATLLDEIEMIITARK